MKAILTKYHGPTNTRGSRITASADGVKKITINYRYDLDAVDVHKSAATQLCMREGWSTDLVGGQLPNGDWVFCFKNQ